MSISTFDPQDARLTAYAFGELDGAERAAVERLLAESSAAQAALAEIQDTVGLLRTELASEPTPSLTSEQRHSLEAHIAAQSAPRAAEPVLAPTVASSPRRKWVYVVGSLAATAAGVTLMLPAMQQARDASSPQMAATAPMTGHGFHDGLDDASMVKLDDLTRSKIGEPTADFSELSKETLTVMDAPSMADSPTFESGGGKEKSSDRRGVGIGGGGALLPAGGRNKQRDSSEVQSNRQLAGAAGAASSPSDGKPEPLVSKSEPESLAERRNAQPKPDNNAVATATKKMPAAPMAGPTATTSSGLAGGVGGGGLKADALTPLSVPQDSKPQVQAASKASGDSKSSPVAGDKFGATQDGPRPAGDASKLAEGDRARGTKPQADFAPEAEATKLVTKLAAQPNNALAKNEPKFAAPDSQPLNRTLRESLEQDEKRLKELSFAAAPTAETYEAITENEFATPGDQPLSTFSIDVDSASYANVRRFLTQGQLPPPNAVRIEELINYFSYDYPQPKDGQPFSVTADAVPCPWQRDHYIARVALKARHIEKTQRPPTNLVFLVDVSGSMQPANKLPLVKRGLTLLAEEMNENDHISIVTYAGDAGLKLEPTKGSDQVRIMQVIDSLTAGGSTNGAAGINMAYEQALRHFHKGGANRVILCTDGDFNVGVSSDGELVKLIEAQATSGVFLSIFGFGMGNLKDSKLEKLADKGNGHYGYIDDLNEARKVFNEELVGTLYTVAKDVKLQVEFNPLTVGGYRLIGYENRVLAAKDFNDDKKDAGEIGAGHTVTALYEIVPKSKWPLAPGVDPLKYAAADKKPAEPKPAAAGVPADAADDLFTVKLRYKQPDATTSVKTVDYVVDDIAGKKDIAPSRDLLWAASVASFGMNLRHSKHAGTWTLADVIETADGAKGEDPTGRKAEFISLVKAAQKLMPATETRKPQ